MTNATPEKVFAVVVTYFPQPQPLLNLLKALVPQVAHVVVVDNTSADDPCVESLLRGLALPHVELIRLGANLGVAKALNMGIESAMQAGATHVLLSDQDSLPAPDMVEGLLRAIHELQGKGLSIGAVGPSFVDQVSTQPYRFQVRRPEQWFYSNQEPTEAAPHVQTLSLITSGTLIPVQCLRDIGMMREDFFIDHVDMEWSHRALAAGFALFGTRYAKMSHHMGDCTLRAWVLGWRNLNEYGPLRLYYRFRNFVYLLRLDYVPRWWKLRASCFWLQEAYAHLVFSHARLGSLRMIVQGCWDGLRGHLGRYHENQRRSGV